MGGALHSGLGLLAGAAAFVIADSLLDRYVSGRSGPEQREVVAGEGARRGVGLALLAAVTLDGVPENLALGVSLVGGASISLLVAIFFSNLPESLVGAMSMRNSGMSARAVIGTWSACAALWLALWSWAGPRRVNSASRHWLSRSPSPVALCWPHWPAP